MSVETTLWIAAVLFIAGYVRGFSGFGFSAVTVLGLSLVTSPVVAVSTAVLLEVLASVVQARSVWRQIDWNGSAILLVGSILGTPVGVMILDFAPPMALKAAIYCFLLLSAGVLALARPRPVKVPPVIWLGIAIVAGVINGASALSGLFIVTAMTFVSVPPDRMRATLVVYFFFSDIYAGSLLAWRGMIGGDVIWLCLAAIPVVVTGIYFGSRKFHKTSDRQFRLATLGFLAVLSSVGLATLVVPL